jgi:hypothetical protein
MRARFAFFAACLGAALLPSAAPADSPDLIGIVGARNGYGISLVDPSAVPIRHLDPGTYTIGVHDLSIFHNFHLVGPGVDRATAIGTMSDETWTVTLTDGVYTFMCDAHPSLMTAYFAVGSATLPQPATSLRGSVGPGHAISLRYASGGKLHVLAGSTKVVIAVNDRSRTDDFHLSGPGVSKSTGVRFRGRVTWNLALRTGKYVYRSDRHARLRGSFTVSSSP